MLELVGKKLKIMRIEAGIKAIDVAIALKWCPTKLSLIENNRTKISPEMFAKISETIKSLERGKA